MKQLPIIGVWIENIVNITVTIGVIFAIPYYVWTQGIHWIYVAAVAVICFFGSGFLAERVLFRLHWAEKIFGKPDPKPLGPSAFEQEIARRTKERHVDFKDSTTEVDLADIMMGMDLGKKEFTLEDNLTGIFKEDLFELASKGRPRRNPKKYHIDEAGIRITQRHGPEKFYRYADIEEIELEYLDGEGGEWEGPLPIYKANLITFTAAGRKYTLPFRAPWNAAWFVIQKYNELRVREYRNALDSGRELPIGKSNINETVFMGSRGFRSRSISIPVEDLWKVTIRRNGDVDISGKGGLTIFLVLDYALPETYVILKMIREMVVPRAIPQTDKKYAPGALNKMRSVKTVAVLAAISIICFVFCGYYTFKGMEAATWPKARGTVLNSKVSYSEPFDIHEVKVSYGYAVDGKSYTGDRFKYGAKLFLFEKSALRLAREFSKGREISVYYNPLHAEQAVLEGGVGFYFYFIMGCALLALVLAVYYVLVYRKAEALRKEKSRITS